MTRKTVVLKPDIHALLWKKHEETGQSMKELAARYVEAGCLWDLETDDWTAKIEAAKEGKQIRVDENRFQILDSDCPALAWTKKDGFVCCRNAPTQKKLGDGLESDMSSVCSACERIKGVIEERDKLREQVKHGMIVDLPSCIHGGKVTEDGKKIYCQNPELSAQYRDVNKFCKVLRNGANCSSLRWTRIEVKGKFADPKK